MKIRRSRLAPALMTAALVISLAACGGGGGSSEESSGDIVPGAILKYGNNFVPSSLNPRQVSPYEAALTGLLYDSLIRRADDGSYEPGLATEWELSEDLLSLTFTLREGVTFHDGAPFDAEAVKANIDAAHDPATVIATQLANVKSVEVLDDAHVTLNLATPGTAMLGVFAGEAGQMISPEKIDDEYLASASAGAGPYQLESFTGGNVKMRAFADYWNKDAVKLAGIDVIPFLDSTASMRALQSGQLDAIATIDPKQAAEAESAGLGVITGPIADFYGVILNTGKSEFDNPLVRQAMMLALDRPAIAESLGGCAPNAQPFPEDSWAHVPELEDEWALDRDRAKDLLKQAGLPDGFTFELQGGTMTLHAKLAQILQAQFAEIGITVKLRPMENVQFLAARREGAFEATASVYQNSRPDPSQFIRNFYQPDGIFNPADFSVPGGDDLLGQSLASPDVEKRAVPMRKLITKVTEAGPPVLPICTRTLAMAHRPNVQGLTVEPQFDPSLLDVAITK